jgi:RNA polymerase sigma-70 factor (ECF subfamily)
MTAPAPHRAATAATPARASARLTQYALEDGRLTERHLAGDPQAFGALVDRYQTRLLNFINRGIDDRDRAEDLVQEVFVRVFRHLHRFDRTKTFSTWIYTIASNLTKNELRSRSRNPLVLRPVLEFEDTRTHPDDLFRRSHLAENVAQCVSRLPEALRDVFVLRELEGKTYQDIAEITGCNVGTVKSRLSRARSAFAQLIKPLWQDLA